MEKEILISKKNKNGPLNIEKHWAYKKVENLDSLNNDNKKVVDKISNKYKLFMHGLSYTVKSSRGEIEFD